MTQRVLLRVVPIEYQNEKQKAIARTKDSKLWRHRLYLDTRVGQTEVLVGPVRIHGPELLDDLAGGCWRTPQPLAVRGGRGFRRSGSWPDGEARVILSPRVLS